MKKIIKKYYIFAFLAVLAIIVAVFLKGNLSTSNIYIEKRKEQLQSVKTFGGIFFYENNVLKYIGGGSEELHQRKFLL